MLDLANIPPQGIRTISRAEYDRMVELGWFEDEHIELLYGVLVAMSPQGARHSGVTQRLAKRLTLALGERADVFSHSPLAASDESEPEPDINVAPAGEYRKDHPSESFLVIEVAHSSLAHDRGTKARLYAESGVPEYWIVDLVAGAIEVYTDIRSGSDGPHYGSKATHGPGESITVGRFSDVSIAVSDIV